MTVYSMTCHARKAPLGTPLEFVNIGNSLKKALACRAWSKYTQGSSRYAMLHAKEEGAPEKKPGVRELKKLKKKEREGQGPEEGAL